MHTLIQTITHWIYYHTTAKLYDFIRWVFNFYVYRATLYLYWFSKEAPRLIIQTRASAVGIQYKKRLTPSDQTSWNMPYDEL
jgi:hypothetical protein